MPRPRLGITVPVRITNVFSSLLGLPWTGVAPLVLNSIGMLHICVQQKHNFDFLQKTRKIVCSLGISAMSFFRKERELSRNILFSDTLHTSACISVGIIFGLNSLPKIQIWQVWLPLSRACCSLFLQAQSHFLGGIRVDRPRLVKELTWGRYKGADNLRESHRDWHGWSHGCWQHKGVTYGRLRRGWPVWHVIQGLTGWVTWGLTWWVTQGLIT